MTDFQMTDRYRFTKILQSFENSTSQNNPDKFLREYYNTKLGLHPLSSEWGVFCMKAYICINFNKIVKLLTRHVDIQRS